MSSFSSSSYGLGRNCWQSSSRICVRPRFVNGWSMDRSSRIRTRTDKYSSVSTRNRRVVGCCFLLLKQLNNLFSLIRQPCCISSSSFEKASRTLYWLYQTSGTSCPRSLSRPAECCTLCGSLERSPSFLAHCYYFRGCSNGYHANSAQYSILTGLNQSYVALFAQVDFCVVLERIQHLACKDNISKIVKI